MSQVTISDVCDIYTLSSEELIEWLCDHFQYAVSSLNSGKYKKAVIDDVHKIMKELFRRYYWEHYNEQQTNA